MISAAQARESDDLRNVMSPFSIFLSSFLGYVRPREIEAVRPPKRGEEGAFLVCIWRSLRIGTAVACSCDIISL